MRAVGDPLNGAWRLDPAGDYPVHCLTLKDFFDKEGIEFADLVKMDVEGAELSIFKSDGFPKDRIGTMIGELHSDLHGQDEIRKVIEWLGFRYYIIPNNHFLARR
jgi:hypothetical protein